MLKENYHRKKTITSATDLLVCHETHDSEDDKSGKYAGGTIQNTDKHCVPETVIVEFTVAGECNETAPPNSKWKEYLGCCAFPH